MIAFINVMLIKKPSGTFVDLKTISHFQIEITVNCRRKISIDNFR